MYDELYDQTHLSRHSPHLIDLFFWTKKLRRAAGVWYMPEMTQHPNYLLFVKSFFGLEPLKDLPPPLQAAGPILSDECTPLDKQQSAAQRKPVAYVAIGTHVILTFNSLERIFFAAEANNKRRRS